MPENTANDAAARKCFDDVELIFDTPSKSSLSELECCQDENKHLSAEFHRVICLYRKELHERRKLETRIDALLGLIPAGVLPAKQRMVG